MAIKDVAVVKAYHQSRIARFGAETAEALGWKFRDRQLARFEEFTRMDFFEGCSVLDVGCGHGDLLPALQSVVSEFHYTGIDQSEEFLQIALQRYGREPNARFLLGEFGSTPLPRSDFVICCGALNYRNSDVGYLQRMIVRFFEAANIGVGLNLLGKIDFEDGVLVAHSPAEVLAFCRMISPYVEIRQSPDDDNFTVFMFHENRELLARLPN
jgi:SAM-dependent methyltransferase